jgi:molybdenum cofactor cytidylyltransferase
MSVNHIGIVILAGGASRKLGTPKQLVEFRGETLLRRAAQAALLCECDHTIVVLGSRAAEIEQEIRDLAVETVVNDGWEGGISTSLKAGLTKLMRSDPELRAVVIMLSDQPFVSEKTIRSLIDTYNASGKPIVASEYEGVLGVPALFDREVFEELLALEGDAGARIVIRQGSDSKTATVSAPEAAFDVDTPADHHRLNELEAKSRATK